MSNYVLTDSTSIWKLNINISVGDCVVLLSPSFFPSHLCMCSLTATSNNSVDIYCVNPSIGLQPDANIQCSFIYTG